MTHQLQAIAGAALLAAFVGSVEAAAQRTFVSTGGSDANVCSLAAPCRSFGAAIVQTLDKGEIVVLDSGGYGPVVINKSIEIVAPPGVYAGITASAGTAIQIVSPAQNVAVRGVAINGLGTGQFGIDVQFGAQITVERCRIANFTQDGLRFANAAGLSLRDCEIRDNGVNGFTAAEGKHMIERTTFRHNANNGADVSGVANVTFIDTVAVNNGNVGIRAAEFALATMTGGAILENVRGVHVDGSVPSSFTRVAIDRVNISNNSQIGVFAYASSNNAIVQLSIARSLFVENFEAVAGVTFASGAAARVFVSDSVFERNANRAQRSDGTLAELTIENNVVTGSGQGIAKFSSGAIYTRLNNTVRGNTTEVQNGPLTSLSGT